MTLICALSFLYLGRHAQNQYYLDGERNTAHVTSWLRVRTEVEFLGMSVSEKGNFILRSENRV